MNVTVKSVSITTSTSVESII